MEAKRELRACAAPVELDWQQQKRRPIAALVAGLAFPAQETDGQEKRIGAALREIVADLAMQFDQPCVEILGIELRCEPPRASASAAKPRCRSWPRTSR